MKKSEKRKRKEKRKREGKERGRERGRKGRKEGEKRKRKKGKERGRKEGRKDQPLFWNSSKIFKSYFSILKFENQSRRPFNLINIIWKSSHVQPVAHERFLFDSQHSWGPGLQAAGLHEFKYIFYFRKWKSWGRGGWRSVLMMAHWTLLRLSFEWESYIGCSSYRGQPEIQWSKGIKTDSQMISQKQVMQSLHSYSTPLIIEFYFL